MPLLPKKKSGDVWDPRILCEEDNLKRYISIALRPHSKYIMHIAPLDFIIWNGVGGLHCTIYIPHSPYSIHPYANGQKS